MTKTKDSKKCKSKCGDKCHSKKRCCEECPEITAEKNLLNLSYLTEGSGISGPDISATFEIVIFNRSCHKLTHLSIDDTFMGLLPNDFTPEGTFGGELRPYFTNVTASTPNPTVFLNTFEQIVAGKGELLAAGSYVPPCSVCSILVRITGRGFLLPIPPDGHEQIAFEGQADVNMAVQNSAIIKGNIKKKRECGCRVCVPIFPIYVKSGIQCTQKWTNVVFPQFNNP